MKMWKVYENADANDDNDRQRTNFDQKSSLEPSAQVSEKRLLFHAKHFDKYFRMTRYIMIVKGLWRRRFLYFVNVFSLFRYYLPLEKGGPFIWTNLNSHHQRMLCAKFGWIDTLVLGRRWKCEKFTTTPTTTTKTRTTMDNGQILIRKAHLSLQFRWAKNVCFSMLSI